MNESSEVKVLVRSASNLSGRSIKRNLLHRKRTTLIALGWITYGCRIRRNGMKTIITREEITPCTWRTHRCMECDMIGKSHYQSWEGLMASQYYSAWQRPIRITYQGNRTGGRKTGGWARSSDEGYGQHNLSEQRGPGCK